MNETKLFGVLIDTGNGYGPKVGWDTAYTSRKEAEDCAARARRQGWEAKAVEVTEADGWERPESFPAWESRMAAAFGGIYSDWPEDAQARVREHYGCIPRPR